MTDLTDQSSESSANQAEEIQAFYDCLDELANYKKYFEKEENLQTLVDWLHDDTGINKFVLRKTLKHIAPLVIAKLVNSGEKAAKGFYRAWINKLHDKLADYAWYRDTCQKLLNTLKKRSDQSYGKMLDQPDINNPQALLSHQGQWSNLKDEQKAVVQLLLGQQTLNRNDQQILSKIDELLHLFQFELQLETPSDMEEEAQNATMGSASWLTFTSRQSTFLGRDQEMQLMQAFLDDEQQFSWCCVTGEGGTGKSRLGLELMMTLSGDWEKGFVSKDQLNPMVEKRWQPAHPTLLIVDYGADASEELGVLINYLIGLQKQCDQPLRLLILERFYKEQDWWKSLTLRDRKALTRQNYLYHSKPIELPPIVNQQGAILRSYLDNLGYNELLPEQDAEIWERISHLSDQGKPLYLGMIAIAIADKGIAYIRQWGTEQLLSYLLTREQGRWTAQLQKFTETEQAQITDLMLLATLAQGLDFTNQSDAIKKAVEDTGIAPNLSQLNSLWRQVKSLTGNNKGTILPDIFAEFTLMHYWGFAENEINDDKHIKILAAFEISPDKTLQVIARSATDFPNNLKASVWWQSLWQCFQNIPASETEPDNGELNIHKTLQQYCFNAGMNIVGQLSLTGHYHASLQHWLKYLSQALSPQQKARAINMIGLQYFHLSDYQSALPFLNKSLKIQQDIGDKVGEGRTLNNISLINHANGQYDTALDYLQKSLKIQQDLGDKDGEGTTLCNISQTYKARGEYDTALDYLQQSLKITQDTGDIAGEGTTLNNISQIYKARGQYDTALEYLQQSLKITQDIGDKAGEGVTLNNISLIFDARGQKDTALDYLQQSLKITQDIGDKASEGRILNNISQIFDSKGQYDAALDYLQKSLKIQQGIGDKAGEGMTLNNISQIFDAKGQYDIALDCLQQSLKILRDIGDKVSEGTILNNISLIHHANGQYDTALNYLRQSLKIQQDIGDKASFCATLYNMGYIYLQYGNVTEARGNWLTVYEIAKPMNLVHILEVLESMAPKIGLKGGLAGWESLAEQMKDTEADDVS